VSAELEAAARLFGRAAAPHATHIRGAAPAPRGAAGCFAFIGVMGELSAVVMLSTAETKVAWS
jgi:ABC-type Fe3+ transport system permease subunit